MRRTVYLIGLCLVLTVGLYGCGSSNTADSGQPAATAKTATATFSVTIPQKAVKSLIPGATSFVYLNWGVYNMASGSYAPGELYLYPDATGKATASVNLVPGIYWFDAACFDASGSQLSATSSMANVTSGANNIMISFIAGRWTFAAPIVLSGGETLTLSSFDITPTIYNYYGDYPVTFNITDASNAAINATGYTNFMSISGDLSSLAAMYGFPSLGAGSQFDLIDFTYNITQGTTNSNWVQGDRVFVATSIGPGVGGFSSVPDISSYFNTKLDSGTAMSGTLLEFTVGTYSETPATTTTGICTMQQPGTPTSPQIMPKKSTQRSKALASAIAAKATKSVVNIGNVTITYPSCTEVWAGGESFTDSNGNGWYDSGEFYDMNGNGIYDAGIDTPYSDYNGNGVYDPAEPFTDTNGNGYFDQGTPTLTEVVVTETMTNASAYPFTATATELTLATPTPLAKR